MVERMMMIVTTTNNSTNVKPFVELRFTIFDLRFLSFEIIVLLCFLSSRTKCGDLDCFVSRCHTGILAMTNPYSLILNSYFFGQRPISLWLIFLSSNLPLLQAQDAGVWVTAVKDTIHF